MDTTNVAVVGSGVATVDVTIANPQRTALKDSTPEGFPAVLNPSSGDQPLVKPVSVTAWPARADGTVPFPELDDPHFQVPGLHGKDEVAVCISGGGFRATTLALGWLRALHNMKLLYKVKYLSVVSGSSWLGAALCFQQKADVGEFLGPYLPPEHCTLEALQEVGAEGRSYAKAVADSVPLKTYLTSTFFATIKKFIQLFDTDRLMDPADDQVQLETARQWTHAMTDAFLKTFGLGEMNKSTVACSGTRAHATVEDRATAAARDMVYTCNVDQLPFLIIGQALMLPKTEAKYFPFEWTPLYGGCPVAYNDIQPKLGAGWVETLGLNAKLVKDDQSQPAITLAAATSGTTPSIEVKVRPSGPASLGEAIGISSAYSSYDLSWGANSAGTWAHKMLGFHTADYFDLQDFKTSHLQLTDGGACDLFGIYPALRRKVPNIMVLIANGKNMEDAEGFAKYMRDLPALFGEAPADADDKHGPPPAVYNQHHKVFKEGGYRKLFAALHAKKTAGDPAVVVEEYDVLENQFMGIPGGWKARIMWVVNDAQAKWEAKLPHDTKAKLDTERSCKKAQAKEDSNKFNAVTFRDFPNIDTKALDYTPELVSMMANHAAWMLINNADLVKQMFHK